MSWKKDTEDLFDFEATDVIKKTFQITPQNQQTYIYTDGNCLSTSTFLDEVILLQKEIVPPPKIISFIKVNNSSSSYILSNPIISKELHLNVTDRSILSRLWRVSPRNTETLIKPGDVVKLGRIRLKFRSIHLEPDIAHTNTNNNNVNVTGVGTSVINNSSSKKGTILGKNSLLNNMNANDNSNANGGTITNVHYNTQNEAEEEEHKEPEQQFQFERAGTDDKKIYCRICYCSESDEDNPLISPCKCSGSMGYIHYACLKHCLDSKITKKEDEYHRLYCWKTFECEICKLQYPESLKYGDRIYSIVDLQVTFKQYVTCDYFLFDDTKKETFRKGILVINLSNDSETTIGRTAKNRIKLKDISVSRVHCVLKTVGDKLYIVDKGSKFGTMIYVNRDIELTEQMKDNAGFVSGKHFYKTNIVIQRSFFESLFNFPFQCCECKTVKERDFVLEDDEPCVVDINKQPTNKNKEITTVGGGVTVKGGYVVDFVYENVCLEIQNLIIAGGENEDGRKVE